MGIHLLRRDGVLMLSQDTRFLRKPDFINVKSYGSTPDRVGYSCILCQPWPVCVETFPKVKALGQNTLRAPTEDLEHAN